MNDVNEQKSIEKADQNYWTKIKLYHTGDEYYSAVLTGVRHAKKTITLESYIFAVDKLTGPIIEELGKAVLRGVEVKLLIDGFGSYFWLPRLEKECQRQGIYLRVFHPLPSGIEWFKRFFWFFFFRFFRIFKKFNRRNHRKITVIDGTTAFIGSLNYTQLHSESVMGDLAWRDTGAEIEGPQIKFFNRAFYESWTRASHFRWRRFKWKPLRERLDNPAFSLVRLNTSQRMRFRLYRDLLRRIRSAKHRILITTAYFLPRRSLIRALVKTARRGVRISVIVPGISDVPMIRWAGFELSHKLLNAGVEIYEYQGRILHAKYMLIDDWASVGSLNLNHRSFLHDLEVEAVFTDSDSLENISNQWNTDRNSSSIVLEEHFLARSWWKRMISRLIFRLRYFL